MSHILEMFGEPITYGGQESVVYNMLSTLNLKNDFKVDLFTPYFADNMSLINMMNDNNGKVYALGLDFRINDNRFRLYRYIDSFFKTHATYDIVHIHTGSLTTMLVYAMIAKKYRIKVVIVHSHTTGRVISLFTKLRRFILCKFLKRYVDIYIGCSIDSLKFKFTKDIVKKSIVVNNGIDINRFDFNAEYRDEIKNKYSINDKFVVGSLGRLSFEKNHEFMIDIIHKVLMVDNDVVLLIVGNGDMYDRIYNKCKDLNISEHVVFTGAQAESFKYYSAFDCFVMPSIYEGMPVTAIEAQISGLPVFLSDRITNDCVISNATRLLSIDCVDIWKEVIVNIKNSDYENERKKYKIEFDKFDRKKTYCIIKDIYMRNYEKN